MMSADLRERLKLSRAEWARALSVNERTVVRWEEEGADPGGMATEVMRGISHALDEGADPVWVSRVVSFGVGTLVYYRLKNGP